MPTEPNTDPDGNIRLAHMPTPTVNERFRDYVQSQAFTIALSRRMIDTLILLDYALAADAEVHRVIIHDVRLDMLERRGLVRALLTAKDRHTFPRPPLWRQHYQVTNAGKLVLLLLVEAGMREIRPAHLPPPPPGWKDPRPRLVVEDGVATIRPSRLAEAQQDEAP